MLAAILAAVLGATAPEGTLFTNDGGRVRGSLVEAGPAGVTMKLLDGSTRRFAPTDVRKVVLADGSLWRPGDPPPAPPEAAPAAAAAAPLAAAAAAPEAAPPAQGQVPAPAEGPVAPSAGPAPGAAVGVTAAGTPPAAEPAPPLASPMLIPVDRLDTIFLASGGRVRGLVTEETGEGVVVRLVDGTERKLAPAQVKQITYADGTVSVPGATRD